MKAEQPKVPRLNQAEIANPQLFAPLVEYFEHELYLVQIFEINELPQDGETICPKGLESESESHRWLEPLCICTFVAGSQGRYAYRHTCSRASCDSASTGRTHP